MKWQPRGDVDIAAQYIRSALHAIAPELELNGDLDETPARMARALDEMMSGYGSDPARHLERTFDVAHDEVVVVRDIPFASLCEHHVLPFSGHVSCAYIPSGRIVGLSKIPRMVAGYAARLQVQERLTEQVARALEEKLQPKGVAVYVRGVHSCMQLRGVRSHGEMVTNVTLGAFRTDASARVEVMKLMGL